MLSADPPGNEPKENIRNHAPWSLPSFIRILSQFGLENTKENYNPTGNPAAGGCPYAAACGESILVSSVQRAIYTAYPDKQGNDRIISHTDDDNIVLLHGFVKKKNREIDHALEMARARKLTLASGMLEKYHYWKE